MPPLESDVEGEGAPSDHSTPFLRVQTCREKNKCNYTVKTVRPLPESSIHEFGRWIAKETFDKVENETETTKQVEVLTDIFQKKIDQIFPTKQIKSFKNDKEFMDERL